MTAFSGGSWVPQAKFEPYQRYLPTRIWQGLLQPCWQPLGCRGERNECFATRTLLLGQPPMDGFLTMPWSMSKAMENPTCLHHSSKEEENLCRKSGISLLSTSKLPQQPLQNHQWIGLSLKRKFYEQLNIAAAIHTHILIGHIRTLIIYLYICIIII